MKHRTKRRRRLHTEQLESRYCLSAVSFIRQDISNSISEPVTRLADVDNDGDLDIVAASSDFLGGKIGWHENLDGEGTFSSAKAIGKISNSAPPDRDWFVVSDMDADGDVDILIADQDAGFPPVNRQLILYENTNGLGNFERHQTNIIASNQSLDRVSVLDVDGDGDADVVAVVRNFPLGRKLVWYEKIDGLADFSDPHTIFEGQSVAYVSTGDLDGDGDFDVVAVTENERLEWYENTDGRGTFSDGTAIGNTVGLTLPADLDGDGDLDLIAASRIGLSPIHWYENLDGRGDFGGPRTVAGDGKVVRTQTLATSDVDQDGDLDVVTVSSFEGKIEWHENLDGQGNFDGPNLIVRAFGAFDIKPVDFGDIDLDAKDDFVFFHPSEQRIVWMRNEGGPGNFVDHTVSIVVRAARSAFTADVDDDGDLDVVFAADVAGDPSIGWYENVDGRGKLGPLTIIANTNVNSIIGADVDGDGDVDVIATQAAQKKIEWFPNQDGKGNFGTAQTVVTNLRATSISATDLDGDGDLDVIAGDSYEDTLTWISNDGTGVFDSKEVITACEDGVFPIDFDGDSDLDVVTWGDRSAWYENIDGQRFSDEPHWITQIGDHPRKVSAADMDGDGDFDFLVQETFKVVWHENVDGALIEQKPITTGDFSRSDHYVGDMDGDGDVDVVLSSGVSRRIFLFENSDGSGKSFTRRTIADQVPGLNPRLFVSDMDGDRDLDILATFEYGRRISWFENRVTADSNNDGIFDSGDLIAVFAAGEYEDEFFGNSTYEEGDWNGDGDFDSSDLIIAFQSGNYVAAVRPLVSDIAGAMDGNRVQKASKPRAFIA